MALSVRVLGNTFSSSWRQPKRAVFSMADGKALQVVIDPNGSGAAGGDGTNVPKIYVYELNAARTTVTLKATFSCSVAEVGNFPSFTAASYSDGSIGIIYTNSQATGSTYFVKYTAGTATFGAREVASAIWIGYLNKMDMTVTDGGAVIVGAPKYNGNAAAGADYVVLCRSTAGSWSNPITVAAIITGDSYTAGWIPIVSSITWIGGISTARNFVFVCNAGSNTLTGGVVNDTGWSIYSFSLNETNGAVTTVVTSRVTGIASKGSVTAANHGYVGSAMLWKTGNNEYTLGGVRSNGPQGSGSPYLTASELLVMRGTYDGVTHSTVIAPTKFTSSQPVAGGDSFNQKASSFSYYNDQVVFFSRTILPGTTLPRIGAYYINIDRLTGALTPSGQYFNWYYTLSIGEEHNQVTSGNDRNFTPRHDVDIHRVITTTSTSYAIWAGASTPAAPIGQYPPTSTINTSTPPLRADRAYTATYIQSKMRVRYQFATNSGFTLNVKTYDMPESKAVVVPTSGTAYIYDSSMPATYRLPQGTWYMRTALLDSYGNVGPYIASPSILTVSHPPTASPVDPLNGDRIPFFVGTNLQVSWTFSDPSATDSQTAYRVVLERASDGFVITDTGMVASNATAHLFAVDVAYKDVPLRWKVLVSDTDAVNGPYSAYQTVTLADTPTATITSPTNGATVTSGIPSVTFSVTTPAGRTIAGYNVEITQGGSVVWTVSKTVSMANGASATETAPQSVLQNNQSYSIRVTVVDSTSMSYTTGTTVIFTAWTPPTGVTNLTALSTPYNVESQGYVQLNWTNANQDTDFSGWVIYRKADLINPTTLAVIESGAYEEIARDYDNIVSHEYHDYLSPSGYKVTYKVAQEVNRFGDAVESVVNNEYIVYPKSDGYWLIEANLGASEAFRISIVTGDSFTDEYEEASYSVIGRGRHVDKGQHLGYAGQLDAQIRDSTTRTARYQRLRLETIKQEARVLWLRNPFGDIFMVSVGNMGIERIAGVGSSEFVNMSIPYSKVD